jgi:hypothetical protein
VLVLLLKTSALEFLGPSCSPFLVWLTVTVAAPLPQGLLWHRVCRSRPVDYLDVGRTLWSLLRFITSGARTSPSILALAVRFGLQSAGGAHVASTAPVAPFEDQ